MKSALAVAFLSFVICTPALAAAPSAPDDLRAEVYSDTAAEVFWSRAEDDGLVVAYEVRINDEIVATRDALSHFMTSLELGRTYEVVVTAIDDEGDRSVPVSLSFIGGDRSPPGTTDPGGTPPAVASPTGLVARVYSQTAAEIMWDRSATFGLTYEISRNGGVVRTTDGISHYDDTLSPGTDYDYEVVAIDALGRRSAVASVSLRTRDGADSEPGDTPPATGTVATPIGLVARVYSQTAAEIMWDRSATFGLTYEISRNGDVIRTTDGTSHYDDTLSPGTDYDYEVVAIDALGRRSAAAAVSLRTRDGADSEPDDTPPATDVVATPTGLVARVYSQTAAEIMWDRPATFGLTYEISRNGGVIRTTDGTSHFDDTLSPGTSYTYEVVAIDSQARRSAASVVMFNTPSNGDVPVSAGGASGSELLSAAVDAAIVEPLDVFTRDGYGNLDVIRADIRTVTTPGTCTADDESGCTLDDVLADVDKTDDLTVDIPIHFRADDFPEDGSVSNAELRLRGGGSRFAPQKSFRVKLDSKEVLWRDERYLQLNKHPFDSSRIRNKLAMDVMSEVPHLPSLRTQFVNLWIDDGVGPEDYGLFTHVERLNENFLRKRAWDDEGNIYKAEDFRFDPSDLEDVRVDENGEPLDEDRFESSLEIENGEDHRTLVAMLEALNDPDRSFDSILDRYFDRSNVMAWIAINILVHQADAARHNFLLYNPIGSDTFYFMPWDYDAAMGLWREPPNDRLNDSLRQRVEYGYAVGARNVFLERYYRQPGIHDRILGALDYLRQNHVTDASMTEKVERYLGLVAPFQQREPDSIHNPQFNLGSGERLISGPAENAEAARTSFGLLMPPILDVPQAEGSSWRFAWRAAHDVTGSSGDITYELQIATTPLFEPDNLVVDVDGIEDNPGGSVVWTVDAESLPAGEYYVRLFATPANEPERFWQVSGNKLYIGDQTFYGPVRFRTP